MRSPTRYTLMLAVTVLALALSALHVTPAQAASGSITTMFASNNEHNGNMFDVVAYADIEITGFDINCVGDPANIYVYYKLGTYEVAHNNAAAWTLLGTQTVTCAGYNQPTHVAIGGLVLSAGETYGLYITTDGDPQVTHLNYTNGSTDHSNAHLMVTHGIGLRYPFVEYFHPRMWNGTIYYEFVGETMLAIEDVPDPSVTGQPVDLWISVIDPSGVGYPEGTVEVIGADVPCTVTLQDGNGICEATFSLPGTYVLSAAYTSTNGYEPSSALEEHTVMAGTVKKFRSIATEDGWVRQALNGTFGTNETSTLLRVGDDNLNRIYKSIISFNTGTLVDNAVVTSGTLMVRMPNSGGITGTPIMDLGPMFADIRSTHFGTSKYLEGADFTDLSNYFLATAFFQLSPGYWWQSDVDQYVSQWINVLGRTQFRIWMPYGPGTDGNADNDYISLYSGNITTTAYKPVLELWYYVP